ncbi:MAG: DUF1844 domain-containing protein [Deltaproteobacteria bacterium]|nr:DUF1844 domain-containing protein [Deltaproteobacteria bacterium]
MSEENGKSFKVVDKRKVADSESESGVKEGIEAKQAEIEKETEEAQAAPNAEIPNFEADFANFIYSLNTQALLFLGKIPNPISKKYEKDVGTAKYLIDTIDMLSKKTKGNLDENEAKLIENVLYDLRMAYISEKK